MNNILAYIPAELRVRPQWVNWERVSRGDKIMKLPINSKTGKAADTTDSTTWTTYEEAASRTRDIGFVLSEHDAYVCFDFDHCVEDGVIHPNVEKTMKMLNSYAEYSPSGTGIHVFIKADFDGSRRMSKDGRSIEIYCKDHYLTMTGNHIAGTPWDIYERQQELDKIVAVIDASKPKRMVRQNDYSSVPKRSDEKMLEIAFNAKNGEKFRRLWEGDTSEYDDDDSSADLALCSMLWYWSGDEAQVDRLFRQSGLMRDKWDAPRGASTYGEGVIEKAMS